MGGGGDGGGGLNERPALLQGQAVFVYLKCTSTYIYICTHILQPGLSLLGGEDGRRRRGLGEGHFALLLNGYHLLICLTFCTFQVSRRATVRKCKS